MFVGILNVVFLSQATGLHFRHTDNVIQWLNAMAEKGLPKVSVAAGYSSVWEASCFNILALSQLFDHVKYSQVKEQKLPGGSVLNGGGGLPPEFFRDDSF